MFHGSLILCLLFLSKYLSKSCSPLSLSHACYFPSSLEGTITRLDIWSTYVTDDDCLLDVSFLLTNLDSLYISISVF